MKVKICGITRTEDALCAAREGADYLGLVFVKSSPRFIDHERASRIVHETRRALSGTAPGFVGVFQNPAIDEVNSAIERGLDLVQLHGEESPELVDSIAVPVIKAFRVRSTLPDTAAFSCAAWFLFDTWSATEGGGSGTPFDWSVLRDMERTRPFFLAGGLRPETIGTALSAVRPDGIDLSSGVEDSPGIKNHEGIRELFERIREFRAAGF